ncbi:transaldolase [Frankia sp. CNm7]|uniref:Transaldolase n=1 Tax=Frankia nepalensis TaxID=1836974 RepID=A0A937RJS6_9ACTN|nr:transaldolase [Frankia nepalensis]MBL7499942.1 transaldolase [Frankia nepalensis]MBL7514830.1 transaldolase [Frankia nepalensis]MBL7518708.1 transaldolase [Frankia nepalensis]MBL7633561.1 transaldolase [Frankia nepalensis]
MTNPLSDLSSAGVAVWLDDISRDRLRTGNLAELTRTHSVVGVTTNPTIFQKAVSSSEAYAEQLHDLTVRGVAVDEAVRLITAADVRAACDVLRPVFDATNGTDGRVSIEVDPRLAHETDRTRAEARALWWLVDRPNLFIKIPGTLEGLPAITATLEAGISVNVTLIFGLDRYDAVMDAFMSGIEQALAAGRDISRLQSVASFFVSRVDSEVDKRLEKIGTPEAKGLRAKAAIANARLAYERYEKAFATDRWAALAAAGARPQRPLWASTSTKDPSLPDTVYVDELIAPGTVNTMPEATLLAFGDHGVVSGETIRPRYAEAHATMAALAAAGIDMEDVVAVLEREGVTKFEDSWNQLLDAVRAQLGTS